LGVYTIATVVDDFIDRIMVDPRLNANPHVDEAHHRASSAGFKYLVTELVCQTTGGPQQYSGRSMGDSHRHLMITPQEWQAFLDDFQQTLDTFNVPQSEQHELLALVESTREAMSSHPYKRTWNQRIRLTEPTQLELLTSRATRRLLLLGREA
jgi:hemoglobin